MGMHADDLMFQGINSQKIYEKKIVTDPEVIKEYKWQTHKGEFIKLKDMTNSHLANAIKYFKDNEEKIRLLNIEFNRRTTTNINN